jgi:hypothetical protein
MAPINIFIEWMSGSTMSISPPCLQQNGGAGSAGSTIGSNKATGVPYRGPRACLIRTADEEAWGARSATDVRPLHHAAKTDACHLHPLPADRCAGLCAAQTSRYRLQGSFARCMVDPAAQACECRGPCGLCRPAQGQHGPQRLSKGACQLARPLHHGRATSAWPIG